MAKPVIAIDFDGTLVDHDFPKVGKTKEGAVAAIRAILPIYDVVIFSCRNNDLLNNGDKKYLEAIEEWVHKNQLQGLVSIDQGDHGKPLATAYIDDRGIRYSDNWGQIVQALVGRDI